MQLFELANKLGAECNDVKKLLGVESHMIQLSEQQITKVCEAYEKSKISGTATDKNDPRIRFVSERRNHRIAYGEQTVKFDDFLCLCEKGSQEEKIVRSGMSTFFDIHEVVDKPFGEGEEEQKARMHELLSNVAFSEEGRIPTVRGIAFLRAHFNEAEIADLKANKNNTRVMMVRILDSKSYKDWRK